MAVAWRDISEVAPFAPLTRREYNNLVSNLAVLYQEANLYTKRWVPSTAIQVSGTTFEYLDDFRASFQLDHTAHVIWSLTATVVAASAGNTAVFFSPYLDGAAVSDSVNCGRVTVNGTTESPVNICGFFPEVPRGKHNFDLYWRASSGANLISFPTTRYINIAYWEVRI
jgi:hypothetical protein